MEIKVGPAFVKAIDDRTVTGIFAVLGNIDSYRDRLWPGCFKKTILDRGPVGSRKVRHLWQHDFGAPPIATILALREIGREELPAEVLREAPEATGGLEVERRYLATPRGDEVLAGLNEGALNEGSFGFDPVNFAFTRESEDPNVWPVREVYELRLWDTSDVNWGGNEATISIRGMRLSLDVLLQQFEQRLAEAEQGRGTKAGARHSAADTKLLNAIHAAVVTLGATQCKGIVDEEAADDSAKEDEATNSEKSRAAHAALTSLSNELADLELSLLR